MPFFKVLRRVDAYVEYVAVVEADDARQAADFARDDPDEYRWRDKDVIEFDACLYVTLDDDGDEIPETAQGKLSNNL